MGRRLKTAASEQPGGLQESPGISREPRGFRGRREGLQGRLHPAKEKITKGEVQDKKTELHKTGGVQREGRKGPAGQVFQAINSKGGGFGK